MKLVYFGYDHMLPGVKRLLDDGHELLGSFTFDCDNVFNFNIETIEFTQKAGSLIITSPPEDIHINSFLDKGAEVFIAAGYPYKIPPIDEQHAYATNLHPSLLPKGRGMMPTPTIIMNEPEVAGFTIHKMTKKFDAGDILYQEALPLADDETVDSYAARIAERGTDALAKIMGDLPKYWAEASPQDESRASTFPMPDDQMRMLDWSMKNEQLDKIARAFGSFGVLCAVDGQIIAVYEIELSEEAHDHKPGEVIENTGNGVVMATREGFARLKKFEALEKIA